MPTPIARGRYSSNGLTKGRNERAHRTPMRLRALRGGPFGNFRPRIGFKGSSAEESDERTEFREATVLARVLLDTLIHQHIGSASFAALERGVEVHGGAPSQLHAFPWVVRDVAIIAPPLD